MASEELTCTAYAKAYFPELAKVSQTSRLQTGSLSTEGLLVIAIVAAAARAIAPAF